MRFGLFDSAGQMVAAFDNERDAEEFQNRRRPDTAKRRFVPNCFGQPDDIKQALYSSWEGFETALLTVIKRQCEIKYRQAPEFTEQELLDLIQKQLEQARDSIKDFAPAYHRETLEGWAQGAAEMSHP